MYSEKWIVKLASQIKIAVFLGVGVLITIVCVLAYFFGRYIGDLV